MKKRYRVLCALLAMVMLLCSLPLEASATELKTGIGIVAVSDGDQILRPYSTLYTFSFSTTAAKLKDFRKSQADKVLADDAALQASLQQ